MEDPNLGKIVEEFGPKRSNVVAGAFLSIAFTTGGGVLIAYSLRAASRANWQLPMQSDFGWSWLGVGASIALGTSVIVGAIFLGRYIRRLAVFEIVLFENGFRYRSRETVDDVPWADVSRLRETVTPRARPPRHHVMVLAPWDATSSYTIVTRSGKEYHFDCNSVGAVERLGKLLRAEMFRRSLPFETVRMDG